MIESLASVCIDYYLPTRNPQIIAKPTWTKPIFVSEKAVIIDKIAPAIVVHATSLLGSIRGKKHTNPAINRPRRLPTDNKDTNHFVTSSEMPASRERSTNNRTNYYVSDS